MSKDLKLTIGLATYDDYDGVYFTLQAIRLYHPEVAGRIEFVVIDNHPESKHGEALKHLMKSIPEGRYIPYTDRVSTTVRNNIFENARAPYVLSLDCHVLVVPGALAKLIDFYDKGLDHGGLIQGPLLYDDMKSISTHFDLNWRAHMWGTWGTDARGRDPDGKPFEIPAQGLGLFSCRRSTWPGFNPAFRGFGGEEGYIHTKFRKRGRKAYCLPFLRWVHRFGRPNGVPYPLKLEDRIFNYFVGFTELELDTAPIREHFKETAAGTLDRLQSEAQSIVRDQRQETVSRSKELVGKPVIPRAIDTLNPSIPMVLVGAGSVAEGTGKLIDRCPYVVRFGSFNVQGKEADIGKRTSVWVHTGEASEIRYQHECNLKNDIAPEYWNLLNEKAGVTLGPEFVFLSWLMERGFRRVYHAGIEPSSEYEKAQMKQWTDGGMLIEASKIPPPPPGFGPGTELKNLLSKIGIVATPNCPCNARANEMDRWGVEKCRENIPTIVQWLKEESDRRKLVFSATAAGRLIRLAIWMAERDLKKRAKQAS